MNKEEIDLLEIVFTLAIGECAYNDINNIQKLEYKIKIINKTIDKLRLKHNTQQKEFIEYMNKTIEELECDDVDDEEMKCYLIQRIDTFKEILSKYKKIIGSDINVGSIGGKDDYDI